jgi:hypothetical protein
MMASDLPALLFSVARQKPSCTFSIDYNANGNGQTLSTPSAAPSTSEFNSNAKLLGHSKLKVQQLLNGKITLLPHDTCSRYCNRV